MRGGASQAGGVPERRRGCLHCGACGTATRRPVDASREPAFLCRACSALNVFSAAPAAASARASTPQAAPLEVHIHAQEVTRAGTLHYITLTAGEGCAAFNAADASDAVDPSLCVSFPVYNASPKLVVGAKEDFAPARGPDAAPAGGCAAVAALPGSSAPLCVRLRGGGGAAVFLQRGGTDGPWETAQEWLAPESLPAHCAAASVARGLASAARATPPPQPPQPPQLQVLKPQLSAPPPTRGSVMAPPRREGGPIGGKGAV
jgi:hypothetical protein